MIPGAVAQTESRQKMSRLSGNVTPAKAGAQCLYLELRNNFKEPGFRPLYENTRPVWIVLSAFPTQERGNEAKELPSNVYPVSIKANNFSYFVVAERP